MYRKKSLKNIISIIAVSAMSAVLSLTAFAASGKISFSDPNVNSGQEVNVTMKITADEGTKLQDATVTVKYPSDQLTFINGTDADGGAGTVRIHGASNGKGTNILEYNLKFQTQTAGSFPVTIDTHEVYDADGQTVSMTHLGSSNVQVTAPETVSKNSALALLEVSPGNIEPAFSKDNTEYSVSVGTGVNQLAVNAQPEDSGATVSVDNNGGFQLGENLVSIRVTAPDGATVTAYNIHVIKEEGGAENEPSEESGVTTIEGVQLSSKGKTITIMNPSKDVEIPDGFRQGTISIDGQKVQGWVWGADSDPKYCVVYGMNDRGELNFYRYDMSEKTIQRYFEDPLSADSVSNKEFTELKTELDTLNKSYDLRFLIICLLAVIILIQLIVNMYFISKLRNSDRDMNRTAQRRRRGENKTTEAKTSEVKNTEVKNEPYLADEYDSGIDGNILKHNYEIDRDQESSEFDETQVIRKNSSEDNQLRDNTESEEMGDTMMIPRIHKSEADTSDAANKSAEAGFDKLQDADDDEFETFDL